MYSSLIIVFCSFVVAEVEKGIRMIKGVVEKLMPFFIILSLLQVFIVVLNRDTNSKDISHEELMDKNSGFENQLLSVNLNIVDTSRIF